MASTKKYIGPRQFAPGFDQLALAYANTSLLAGAGSSANPLLDNAEQNYNFFGWWLKASGTTGTTRALYLRLYLDAGAGGEAVRAFTTVNSNTPADTVNAIHASLSFGASAGNVTGEGQAVRATLQIPARALNGTMSAVNAEIWSESASSDVGGTMAFLRFVEGGTQGGLDNFDTKGYLFTVEGTTDGAAKIFHAAAPTTLAASLRVKVGATTYYLPLYSAHGA